MKAVTLNTILNVSFDVDCLQAYMETKGSINSMISGALNRSRSGIEFLHYERNTMRGYIGRQLNAKI